MVSPLPVLNSKPSYWKVQEKSLYDDLTWNIPEQKQGRVAVIGGQEQSFAMTVRTAELMTESFPFAEVVTVMPDAVKVPPMPGVNLVPSTKSGSFAKSEKLLEVPSNCDYALIIGEISKNAITAEAVAEMMEEGKYILTRDAVDAVAPRAEEFLALNKEVTVIASLPQLAKLLREIYYPKMITLSMPLLALVETLHKFTLSYPTTILTFHEGQIVTAKSGKVISTPIEKTKYTPLSLWNGGLAVKALGLMLYNPGQGLEALNAAIFY